MLLDRQTFLCRYPKIAEGTTVFCRDGEKLGMISSMADDSLTVKKGVFFPKDFSLRYDDIDEVKDDGIFLKMSSAELEQWKSPEYHGWEKVAAVNTGQIKAETRKPYEGQAAETVNVPLYEEELEAKKVAHETGKVVIKKVVHTELRHLTVPLAHEEIRIERIKGERGATLSEERAREAFADRTVTVAVIDEDVELTKRPVLKEEVRVTKARHIEDRDVSDKIRSEEVEIENLEEEKEERIRRKAS